MTSGRSSTTMTSRRTTEEPLGTVCECCWRNIPDPKDVWYAEDGTAMCEDCYIRNEDY